MKTKNKGISILVAMGASFLVLALVFATLSSILRSSDQARNIHLSTQAFFASESGIEAAFFHHNSRGAGLEMAGYGLKHDRVDITTDWSLSGRTPGNIIEGSLKEGENIQIPLFWDESGFATDAISKGKLSGDLEITFGGEDVPSSSGTFFGDGTNEILIDWSFSRKNKDGLAQTFVPKDAGLCDNSDEVICDNEVFRKVEFATSIGVEGKVLPGNTSISLSNFWNCSDVAVSSGSSTSSCSDYILSFRPLLNFNGILGIPFKIKAIESSATLPKNSYLVTSKAVHQNFEQTIEIEVPERTSIGAFDYVVLD